MAVNTQEKNIKNCKYTVTQFTMRRSTKLWFFLLRIGLPTFLQGILSMQNFRFDPEAEINSDQAISGLVRLLENMTDANVDKIFDEMFALTFVDGKELLPVMDAHFGGDFKLMIEVLLFSMEVNYQNFLGVNLYQRLGEKLSGMLPTIN